MRYDELTLLLVNQFKLSKYNISWSYQYVHTKIPVYGYEFDDVEHSMMLKFCSYSYAMRLHIDVYLHIKHWTIPAQYSMLKKFWKMFY